MQMELKFDQKEFMETLALEVIKKEEEFWDRADERWLMYYSGVKDAVKEEITRIVRDNEDKILNAVTDKLARDYADQIKLAAVLSALCKKG